MNQPPTKKMVACVACGGVFVVSKNGHPRKHSPHVRPSGVRRRNATERGVCAGVALPGERP